MCVVRFHRTRLVAVAAALLLSLGSARAVDDVLRAAPPPEPDVLRAAPDAGTVAQENRDIQGRWLGATDTAVQEFAKVGGTLTNAALSQFSGISKAISWADKAAPVGAALGGDYRTAISGAVAIRIGSTVTSSVATLFGEAGTVLGGAVGSFFPVVGNIGGSMIGGAAGAAAGGFIAAFGYDKYIKDHVTKGVLAGIAAVVDPLPIPMAEMRSKMDTLMLQAMSPKERALLEASATFGGGEVQLLDFTAPPYGPTKQPPSVPATPPPQQQAALPPGALPPMTHFQMEVQGGDGLIVDDCRVDGTDVRCDTRIERPASWVRSYSGTMIGRLVGTILTATLTTHRVIAGPADPSCVMTEDYAGPIIYVFSPNGTARIKSGPIQRRTRFSGSCSGGNSGSYSGQATIPWRALE